MLKKKDLPQVGYLEDTFHAYGLCALPYNEGLGNGRTEEERHLARLGVELAIVWDRMAYAEYSMDPIWGEHQNLAHLIYSFVVDPAHYSAIGGKLTEEKLMDELREIHQDHVQFIELMDENDANRYQDLFALAEGYFQRLIRAREILQDMGWDEVQYVRGVERLAGAFKNISDQIEYLTLRQFYDTIKRGQYQTLASLCFCGGFYDTISQVLTSYIATEAKLEVELARPNLLKKEYHIEALISFGRWFDFREFDDDASTLMPNIVDLFWPDEHDRGGNA